MQRPALAGPPARKHVESGFSRTADHRPHSERRPPLPDRPPRLARRRHPRHSGSRRTAVRVSNARVDWLVDPRYVELLNLVECIDRRVPFDPRDLMRGGTGAWAVVRELRRTKYDAVIDLQGLLKSAVLSRLVRAAPDDWVSADRICASRWRGCFYTQTPDPGSASHVIDKNLSLVAAVGVVDRTVRFPVAIPRTPTVTLARERVGAAEYALINPGAAWPNKRWPPDEVRCGCRGDSSRFRPAFARSVGAGRGIVGRCGGCRVGRTRRNCATDDDYRPRGAGPRGEADGIRRYRAAAHCGRRRHAHRGAVRADLSRAQWSMVAPRRRRVASVAVFLQVRTALSQRGAVHRRHQRQRSMRRHRPTSRRAWLARLRDSGPSRRLHDEQIGRCACAPACSSRICGGGNHAGAGAAHMDHLERRPLDCSRRRMRSHLGGGAPGEGTRGHALWTVQVRGPSAVRRFNGDRGRHCEWPREVSRLLSWWLST